MKKYYVRASRVDEFMKYHEDSQNWKENQEGFLRMYDILDKYDNSNGNEDVDVLFERATEADQQRMIDLINPANRYGSSGYSSSLYRKAYNRKFSDDSYNQGVIDAFNALFREGLLDEDDF